MKESLFKELVNLVRHLAKLEVTTTAGRINILGMILSLVLAISLSLAPLFETLIRLVHPNISIGVPLLPIFTIFCLYSLVCSLMIGYLEGPRSSRAGHLSSEKPQKPSGMESKKAMAPSAPFKKYPVVQLKIKSIGIRHVLYYVVRLISPLQLKDKFTIPKYAPKERFSKTHIDDPGDRRRIRRSRNDT